MYFSLALLWGATAAALAFAPYLFPRLSIPGDPDFRKHHANSLFAGAIAFTAFLLLALVQTFTEGVIQPVTVLKLAIWWGFGVSLLFACFQLPKLRISFGDARKQYMCRIQISTAICVGLFALGIGVKFFG